MVHDYLNNAKNKDVLTKFLSPEDQKLFNNQKVIFSDLGYERKRAYLFCSEVCDDVDFQIKAIEIMYNQKFYSLTHSQVLGALIGLGITRDSLGDIYLNDKIYVLVTSEMAPFIINNLVQVDKAKVNVREVDLDVITSLDVDNYYETNLIVASLRLDVLVSSITNLSREKAKEYINLKNVKVNGKVNINPDYILKNDDLISIHRFGRTIIKDVIRKTKKDKLVLAVLRTK